MNLCSTPLMSMITFAVSVGGNTTTLPGGCLSSTSLTSLSGVTG
jgi:hypothetical protein